MVLRILFEKSSFSFKKDSTFQKGFLIAVIDNTEVVAALRMSVESNHVGPKREQRLHPRGLPSGIRFERHRRSFHVPRDSDPVAVAVDHDGFLQTRRNLLDIQMTESQEAKCIRNFHNREDSISLDALMVSQVVAVVKPFAPLKFLPPAFLAHKTPVADPQIGIVRKAEKTRLKINRLAFLLPLSP